MNEMKFILVLILSLNFSCAENKNTSISENMDFEVFIIDLWTGDESYYNKRIEFRKSGEEYYGEMINPKYYVGSESLIPNKIKVHQNGLRVLSKFWKKALSFRNGCEEKNPSSLIQRYMIIKNSDTIRVDKFCDWNKQQYSILEEELFSDYFDLLDKNRKNLVNNLNQKLLGQWYPENISSTMRRGDTLILNKNQVNSENRDCSWVFGQDNSYKNNCQNLLNIKHSKKYGWDIDEGSIHFSIEDAFIEKINGNEITFDNLNYGAHFNVCSFTKDKLVLTYLWD